MNHEKNIPSDENSDQEHLMSRRNFFKNAAVFGVAAGFPFDGNAETTEAETGEENVREDESAVYNPEIQRQTLEQVLEIMSFSLDESVPLPEVIPAFSVSDEEFNAMLGFDTRGKRMNKFQPPSTILLIQGAKVHNLAHEMVHYVQYNYQGVRDSSSDHTEMEAIRIQNQFR